MSLSKNNIFHQSVYQRLIMKNSFKISKDIFTSKLKDNVLKFSMLIVKESKCMIYKNSLKSEHYRKNYSNLIQKQYSITRIYNSLE